MVRAKAADPAEKKPAPARKTVTAKTAAAKTAAEKKAAIAEKAPEQVAETKEEEIEAVDEEAPATEENEDVDATAEEAENEGEDGDVEMEDEEQDEQIEDEEKEEKKPEWKPLTEEDNALIADLLTAKIKLSDDTEANIFSYGPLEPGAQNPIRCIICHLCRVSQRANAIKNHIDGKRHKESLKRKSINAEKFKQPFIMFYTNEGEKGKQFQIYPGENIETVTPEYESRLIDRVEWDFKKIDDEHLLNLLNVDPVYEYNKGKPVIGLDYLLKMKDPKLKKSKRYCVLCDQVLQAGTYDHVTNIQHQATYIIKHFPRLYEKVVKGLKITNPRAKEKLVRDVFRKLYRKIEIKYGFKKMIPADYNDFKKFRSRYISKVRRMPHYGEDSLEFTETEVNVLIRKCNNGISFNEPDPPSLGESRVARKRAKPVVEPTVRSRTLPGSDEKAWGTYKNIKDKAIEGLRAKYNKFDENPQSHPNYQKEWSDFWHERCDQLKKENVNPDTYNFDQEWLPYFEKRLRKMYLKEVTERKRALRTKYGLPLSRRTPEPFNQRSTNVIDQPRRGPASASNAGKAGGYTNRANNPPSLLAGGIGGYREPGQRGPRGSDGGRQRGGGRNMQQVPRLMQQNPEQPSRKRPAPRREPVTIVSVLSLLTALEDQLGSLGPKSVQLLSKAVLCEKNNQTNQLLTDNEYYILFATAKEKLKGQIMANVIHRSKIDAANNAIDDLEKMINVMDREARKQNNTVNAPNTGNRNSNCGGDNFGRNAPNMGGVNFGIDSTNFGSSDRMGSGGNYRNNNENFRSGGTRNDNENFRTGGNRNDIENFRSGGGNFQSDAGNYRGDGGNYRNEGSNYRDDNSNLRRAAGSFRNDGENFQNEASNFRNETSNFRNDGNNYRTEGTNFQNDSGNFGGNLRPMDDGDNNYRGGYNNDVIGNRGSNLDSGNYRESNEGGKYRGMNDSGNFSSSNYNMSASNYRANDGMSNVRSGNFNDNIGTGNYRSSSMGGGNNLGGSSSNSVSNYRGGSNTTGGNYASGGSSFGASGNTSSLSITKNFTSDTAEYRSGGNFDNTKYSSGSNYGSTGMGNNNNSSSQRGNWMGGSGNVYSSINKTNTNTPAFTSGMGYQQLSSMSSLNNRNPATNTGMSGGNYGRYN